MLIIFKHTCQLNFRIEIISEGNTRKLIYNETIMSDGGEISVKTIRDSSDCNLTIYPVNRFITGLPQEATVKTGNPFEATVQIEVYCT